MYVVDTNVLSELRRSRPHGAVLAWFGAVPPNQLFGSAATIGEIAIGIESIRPHDPVKAKHITTWLDWLIGSHIILAADADALRA